MKRIRVVAFTVLCLLSLAPLMKYRISVKANPDLIYVPMDYPTIQQAVNHANSGDTILVQNGTYYEHVLINKSLSLVGEDRDLTVVDGNGTGNVISINANNVTVEGFTVMRSGKNAEDSGIHVEHSGSVIVANSSIRDSTNGISLILSNNNTISGNAFVANSFYAVYLSSSGGNMVSDNVISDNYVGVFLFSSTANVVTRNTASDNDYGVFLYSSIDNMISGNNISSNDYGGIYLAFSSNNTIYHNNLNNLIQASSDLMNSWNYSGEGNFWSDYNGQDLNGDGIVDEPYVISSNNRDSCPLMGLFLSFAVAFEGELYHIGVISNSAISSFKFEIGTETGNRIIHLNTTNSGGATGVCRITIPTDFMSYPYFVLSNGEEISPTTIVSSNQTEVTFYFTYALTGQIITIISSEALHLYNELLVQFLQLQADLQALTIQYYSLANALVALNASYEDLNTRYDNLYASCQQLQLSFNDLNVSYYSLSTNFTTLSDGYSQLTSDFAALQKEFNDLNVTNILLSENFSILSGNYSQLLGESVKLQADFNMLNLTYYSLQSNYTLVLGNFSQLLISFNSLNASYQNLLGLNTTYYALLDSFVILSGNYTQLRQDYQGLNAAYQAHIIDYAANARNIQNLIYIFVVVTAIFIVTTIYLSKRAHSSAVIRSKARENGK